MRTRQTLTISLPPAMLKQVEKVSRAESRTQSEFVREALRRYFSGFPVVTATPAELAALARGRAEFEQGEYVTLDALLKDVGTGCHKVYAKRSPKAPAKRSRTR